MINYSAGFCDMLMSGRLRVVKVCSSTIKLYSTSGTLNTDNGYTGKRVYLEVPFEEKMMQRRLLLNGIPCGSWDSSFSELHRDLLNRSDYTPCFTVS